MKRVVTSSPGGGFYDFSSGNALRVSLPLHDVTSRRLKLTVSRHFKHALESAFYDNHFIGSNKSI
ncbi:MAG: hypothetical protein ACKVP9_00400, partial [Burkholderiales bacterium]